MRAHDLSPDRPAAWGREHNAKLEGDGILPASNMKRIQGAYEQKGKK